MTCGWVSVISGSKSKQENPLIFTIRPGLVQYQTAGFFDLQCAHVEKGSKRIKIAEIAKNSAKFPKTRKNRIFI